VDVALILEPKLEMLLTAAQVSQESRERYIEQVERELKTRGLWDGLVADAAKIGLSL
jgi:hypothetical protein